MVFLFLFLPKSSPIHFPLSVFPNSIYRFQFPLKNSWNARPLYPSSSFSLSLTNPRVSERVVLMDGPQVAFCFYFIYLLWCRGFYIYWYRGIDLGFSVRLQLTAGYCRINDADFVFLFLIAIVGVWTFPCSLQQSTEIYTICWWNQIKFAERIYCHCSIMRVFGT